MTRKELVAQISENVDIFHENFPKTTGFGTKTEESRLRNVLWNCWAHPKTAINYKKDELENALRFIEDQNMACL